MKLFYLNRAGISFTAVVANDLKEARGHFKTIPGYDDSRDASYIVARDLALGVVIHGTGRIMRVSEATSG